MCIIAFILLLFAEKTTFAANKVPLASVRDFQGEATVLRNPVRQKSPDFDRRVNSGVHQVSFYMGWYWEAYPINHKTQFSYGDLIRTGAQSLVQIRIQSVHEIKLSENTVIQLVPNFMALLLSQAAKPSVDIIAGKMRIKVNSGPNFKGFTARSSSMVVELGKSDLLMAVKGRMTQVISLDGKIRAQMLSKENQQFYSQSLDHYRSRNYRELSRLTVLRQKQLENPAEELGTGKKIESMETLTQQDLDNLNRLLGAEKTRGYLETDMGFEATPIRGVDLEFFSDLVPDIESIMEKAEFANISDEEMEGRHGLNLDSQTIEDNEQSETPRISQEDPLYKFFAFHLAYVKTANDFNRLYSFQAKALALELEIRPWRYTYSYLAISSGTADTKKMANFLGQGSPQALNSYSHLAMGLGGRVIMGKRLGMSIGVGIINIQKLSIQYDDLPRNVNRTYTVMLDPIPIGELGMTLNFLGDLELFLRYGVGSSFARIEAKDIVDDYKSNGSFSYGTVGLGWNTQ